MATPHILDLVGRGLPDDLPGRGDAWVAVTWSTNDPAVLLRLAREHRFGDLEPGEYIMWRDPVRHLIVQVSYVSDDDDGGTEPEPEPDPSWSAAA
jgi:hypothetical protein